MVDEDYKAFFVFKLMHIPLKRKLMFSKKACIQNGKLYWITNFF